MILNVYAIYDSAAKAYMQPWYTNNDAIALRLFTDNINNKDDNTLSNHPDQFTLFKLAEFDDNKGTFQPIDPKSLGKAIEYKDYTIDRDAIQTEINEIKRLLTEK